jgi:hypothetical protein
MIGRYEFFVFSEKRRFSLKKSDNGRSGGRLAAMRSRDEAGNISGHEEDLTVIEINACNCLMIISYILKKKLFF